MGYFVTFVIALLGLTIWLYQGSLKTIAAKDMEINTLSLSVTELQMNLDKQNAEILEYKADNAKLDKQLASMQGKLRDKYYNTEVSENCEVVVREKLKLFLASIDQNNSVTKKP